jgi:hypothetical protein
MRLRVTIKIRNRASSWLRAKIQEIGFSDAEKAEMTDEGETIARFLWDGNGLAQSRLKRNLDLIFAPPKGRKVGNDPVLGEVSLERLDEMTGQPKKFRMSLAEWLGFKRSQI